MNKKILIISLFLLCFYSYIFAKSKNLALTIKPILNYSVVHPDNYDKWQGYQIGASLSLISKNFKYIFPEYELSILYEKYNLPEKDFLKNSFLSILNIKNELIFNFSIIKNFYLGTGFEFVSQISGKFGDKTFKKSIPSEYLGTDTYLLIKINYHYNLNNKIFIPFEAKFSHDLTIKDSYVLNTGINFGIGFNL
jgi:hypothetical protein